MAKKVKKLGSKEFLRTIREITTAREESGAEPFEKLAEAGISQVVIIVGADPLRGKRLAEWLLTHLFGGEEQVSRSVYSASDLSNQGSIRQAASSFQSLSLFTPYQLNIILNADGIRASAAKELERVINAQSPRSLTLVFTEKLNNKTPLPNYLSESGSVVEFKPLAAAELLRWVKKEASRVGLNNIDTSAIKLLANHFGDNLLELSNSLERAALCFSHDDEIRAKDIQMIITLHDERTELELIGAIAKKDLVRALYVAQSLLKQGLHPLQISYILSRYLRTLLELKLTPETVKQKWLARKIGSLSKMFSADELAHAVHTLKELDQQLKGSKLKDDLLLELCIRRLVIRMKTVVAA